MTTSKFYITLCCFFSLQIWLQAQAPLPKFMTEAEVQLVEKGLYTPPSNNATLAPPPGPVRVPAEWEEMDAVIIVWEGFSSILAQITAALKDEVEVIIVSPNINSTKNYLDNQGIDYSENVSFYDLPSNSIWVRDYGPNSAYLIENNELVWIDWIYNRPRYQDDQIPQLLGAERGVAVYETATAPEDLVNTGGNFMADGLGKGFSSDLVLDENGANNQFGESNHDEEAVDAIMQTYMGIEQYIKMEALPYDLIHHIDMHMKIVDEETILVGEYPEGVADGPQIEANIQYILDQFTTSYGRPFNIKRIPMPPGPSNNYPNFGDDYRTYANALFANKTIIVPTYEEKYDTTALRIWEEVMPGYNVVGIDCNDIIPLSGALHCITKEVAAENPVTINMMTHPEWCMNESIQLQASVTAFEAISSVDLHYKTSQMSDWEVQSMTLNAENLYEANLDALELDDVLQYFIRVETEGGKIMNRPLPGEAGPRSTNIVNCAPVSTYELDFSALEIFPNPASAITCVAPHIMSTQAVSIELLDIRGAKVLDIYQGKIASTDKKFFFDASLLDAGNYVLKIQTADQTVTEQVVVVH